MKSHEDQPRNGTLESAAFETTNDLIAKIKVKALLEFSLTNPEFQHELSLNAANAAKTRGVELDDSELELLVRTFGQMQTKGCA